MSTLSEWHRATPTVLAVGAVNVPPKIRKIPKIRDFLLIFHEKMTQIPPLTGSQIMDFNDFAGFASESSQKCSSSELKRSWTDLRSMSGSNYDHILLLSMFPARSRGSKHDFSHLRHFFCRIVTKYSDMELTSQIHVVPQYPHT